MEKAEKLLRSPIFEDFDCDDIETLLSQGHLIHFKTGQQLFSRGQEAHELMFLQEGVVELLFPIKVLGATRDLIIETKQEGDVVAWSAMVAPYRYTLGAQCQSECTLTSLPREVLESLFASRPEEGYLFMRNLAGVIGQRLHAMQDIWLHDLQASAIRHLE